MATAKTRIQIATLVGNAWEEIVEHLVLDTGIKFDRSPDLGEGVIRPDYLSKDKKIALLVTATGSRETYIKKKWRYINELFQLKAMFGERLCCVNLVCADSKVLSAGVIALLNRLFDFTVSVDDSPAFQAVQRGLRNRVVAGDDKEKVVKHVLSLPEFKTLKVWLQKKLLSIPPPRRDMSALWARVRSHGTAHKPPIVDVVPSTYFRRVCLKLLPFAPEIRIEILNSVLKGKVVRIELNDLERMGIDANRSLGGVRIADSELIDTLANGFSVPEVRDTCLLLQAACARQAFPIHELADPSTIDDKAAAVAQAWPDPKKLGNLFKDANNDEQNRRIWPIEYALAIRKVSMLDANRRYVEQFGKLGVANPLTNILLKTDIGVSIVSNSDVNIILRRIADVIVEGADRSVSAEEVKTSVLEYRLANLMLQPYLNPTRMLFETKCKERGARVVLMNVPSLLNDLGLKGRGTKVEDIYEYVKGRERNLIKVLSGYAGGYEHKADEMGARSWLLRFRSAEAFRASGSPKLTFIYEGEWNAEYLKMLAASGWDELIPFVKWKERIA